MYFLSLLERHKSKEERGRQLEGKEGKTVYPIFFTILKLRQFRIRESEQCQ